MGVSKTGFFSHLVSHAQQIGMIIVSFVLLFFALGFVSMHRGHGE